jgi:type VI secretion system protein VasG
LATLTKLVARLSPSLKAALENAVGEAVRRKAAAVEPVHWLYHIVYGSDSELQSFLEGQGVNMSDLQSELEREMPMGSGEGGRQPTISGSLTKLIEQAWLQASVEMNLGLVTPEVFLLTTQLPNSLGAKSVPISALKLVSTDALRAFASERGQSIPAVSADGGGAAAVGGGDGTALQKYTVNLTQLARDGELDTVLGRTYEVSKAIDVLLRKRQNNPILLGAPGVGKTAVVEGLAQKIALGEVPEQLEGADLVSLDMGLLQAGASVKGEFEERLKNVINEVQASETPIIVFIDEAHTMIGAGGTEGQNDAANLLKPALARGEFRTVGATTFAEYKKYFEKDPALSRRFQPITIEEPSRDASINILRAVAEGLSKHHDVFVREEAIKAAVDLSIRFMPSRRLPDKAISLMDTACARVALSQHARPVQIESLEEELRFVEAELEKSLSDARMFGDVEFDASELNSNIEDIQITVTDRISMWEDQMEKVKHRLDAARTTMQKEGAMVQGADIIADEDEQIFVHPWVSQATVAEVVSDWTGVPISNLGASEAERLLALEDTLKERVIGQDAAIEAIAKSLKISRAGLTDTRKPIGVFMMCGPSGVGKTETALAIADQFFGGEDAVTTINMTEFKEAHKVSMLLGAAAGYVGYGKGGVLTEAVRRRPYCVLLLDEMEKAHKEIHDIFFQIFDKGHISDSEGNDVDFRNTIIIMTSNAGGEAIRDFIDGVDHEPNAQELTDHLRPLLLDWFSPAFIGRTELIAYRPLTPEVGSKLTEIHLNRIKKRIAAQYGATFRWDQSFVDFVVNANSDPLSGGRALEAIINKKFLPRLAEECISRVIEDKPLKEISVLHDGSDVILNME